MLTYVEKKVNKIIIYLFMNKLYIYINKDEELIMNFMKLYAGFILVMVQNYKKKILGFLII